MDIVDEILAVNPHEFLKWDPRDRPEFYDNHLHLTESQWARICATCPGGKASSSSVWGIYVEVVPDEEGIS
jgi:hypothetical protein